MTTTLETIALILTLGVAATIASDTISVETETTTIFCAEPDSGGTYPPPPQN